MALGPKLSVGSILKLSAALPATENQAGYEALTWTEVGAVDSIGNYGNTFQTTEFTPIKTGIVQTLVGSQKNGTIAVTMADLPDDAGQIICNTAVNGATKRQLHSIQVVDEHGYTDYMQGFISKFEKQLGDANKVNMRALDITINTSIVTVAPA